MSNETKSSFTPGPWCVVKGGRTVPHRVEVVGTRYVVANAVAGGGTSDDGEANARLIAAAPELLGALKALLPAAQQGLGHVPEDKEPGDCAGCDAVVAARAAIAKAEGKS